MERLPKWEPTGRSRVYLGNYHVHSGSVEFVLNIITGYISPQYHVLFDKLYPLCITRERAHSQETGKTWQRNTQILLLKKKFTLENRGIIFNP